MVNDDRASGGGTWARIARDLRREWPALSVLLAIFALRIISFGWLAIADPTESRYAEISKRMYESGDWLTPRLYIHGELVPYWGKPPLHFWLTSVSYQLFGVSEWSSRLPGVMAGLLMIVAILLFARHLWGVRVGMISAIILSSSGLFFVLWGACVIDVSLSATMTLAMIAFAMMTIRTDVRARWMWGIAFFLSLGLGMLAKGPGAPAIVILSIGIWLFACPKWRSFKQIPWISGTIVFLAVSLPWYALEEKATPRFLRYFFLNENVLRFFTHNYGDKYGSGHVYPRGTIWAMLAGTYLPWTILLIAVLRLRYKKGILFRPSKADAWFNYVLIWGLTPALFFTLSRQLLATYEDSCGSKSILHSGQPSETILTDALDRYSHELFFFRTKQWQNLQPGFKNRLALVETRGNWTVCQKKQDTAQHRLPNPAKSRGNREEHIDVISSPWLFFHTPGFFGSGGNRLWRTAPGNGDGPIASGRNVQV